MWLLPTITAVETTCAVSGSRARDDASFANRCMGTTVRALTPTLEELMYIGAGAVILILAIVVLLMFFRGRTTI